MSGEQYNLMGICSESLQKKISIDFIMNNSGAIYVKSTIQILSCNIKE